MSWTDVKNSRSRRSNLMGEGFKSLKTDEIKDQTLTLTGVDYINTKNGPCGIMTFKEYPEAFYFCGEKLTQLVKDVMNDQDAMAQIAAGDKCQIIITKDHSEKTGRDYINYELI